MRPIFITVVPLIEFLCYNLLMSGMLNQTRCSLQQSIEAIEFNHSSTQGMRNSQSNFNNMEKKIDSVIQLFQSLVSELKQLRLLIPNTCVHCESLRQEINLMKTQIFHLKQAASLSQLHSQSQDRLSQRQLSSIQLRQSVPKLKIEKMGELEQLSLSLNQKSFKKEQQSQEASIRASEIAEMRIKTKQIKKRLFQSRGRSGEDQRM